MRLLGRVGCCLGCGGSLLRLLWSQRSADYINPPLQCCLGCIIFDSIDHCLGCCKQCKIRLSFECINGLRGCLLACLILLDGRGYSSGECLRCFGKFWRCGCFEICEAICLCRCCSNVFVCCDVGRRSSKLLLGFVVVGVVDTEVIDCLLKLLQCFVDHSLRRCLISHHSTSNNLLGYCLRPGVWAVAIQHHRLS